MLSVTASAGLVLARGALDTPLRPPCPVAPHSRPPGCGEDDRRTTRPPEARMPAFGAVRPRERGQSL